MTPLNPFLAGVQRSVDTRTIRAATRVLGAVILFCVLLGSVRGADTPEADTHHDGALPTPTVATPAPEAASPGGAAQETADAAPLAVGREAGPAPEASDGALPAAIAELMDVGTKFWVRGERESAERTFAEALSLDAPAETKRALLLRMVELYRQADEPLRAIAVLEKFLEALPGDREHPQLVMELGLLYRETGAYAAATSRFYQVLNATLRLGETDLEDHRRLATKARLEIADTYLDQGNLPEARRFYALLQLLDLEAADRERVQFRGAQLQHALKLWQPAERELGAFLSAFPQSAFAAEARYLRAKALKELGRKDEAVQEVIALLRAQDSTDAAQARAVAYWKRRTGNELANTFYEQGDFLGALAIYQALARAGNDPAWQWPAVYQVGLCFERLHLPQRAAEAYKLIVAPEAAAPKDAAPLSEALVSLQGMAKWRLEHLDWIEQFEHKLQSLTAGIPAGA